MRKKNKPKSSNDPSDSNYSESENENKKNMTDSEEDFQPMKRRRVTRGAAAKKTIPEAELVDFSDDSDDSSKKNGYVGSWMH